MRLLVSLLASLSVACTCDSGDEPERSGPEASKQTDPSPTPSSSAGRTPEQIRAQGNHLLGEASPYLQQHAHNPVDWYPWGQEALAKAKAESKPIFLSIGYSTCHWCHVMERESFEDDDVAAFLNEHFVSIKVDREQRPDVDALYIDAVAALGGSTGWPLTVFLTPDLEPFFGGTYYPRHAEHGRPGFMDVLEKVQQMWRTHGSEVAARGREVLDVVERQALSAAQQPGAVSQETLQAAMQTVQEHRDSIHGGFGSAQKFPNAPLLLAQLRWMQRTEDDATREHLQLSLEQMLAGGIRDHVGGSFHRYAVDRRWHVPHFEKTLYDNAQLAGLYIEAGRELGRPDLVAVGRAVLDDLIEHWQRPDGGLIVGFDADDAGGEGTYYTWTRAELEPLLGPVEARIVWEVFGVTDQGEPDLQGRSVLHREDLAEVAAELELSESDVRQTVETALAKMADARKERPAPAADDKELTGWNGLALIALADAARWLDEPRYREAAERIGDFLLETATRDGELTRGARDGKPLGDAVLSDHALAGLGLLRLHAATADERWLAGAMDRAEAIRTTFYDPKAKAFMQTPEDAAGLPVRMADLDDGVLPSGGSAATLLFLELGAIAGDRELTAIAEEALRRTAGHAVRRPDSAGFLLVAIDHAAAPVREVVVAGAPDDPATKALWAEVRPTSWRRILPVRLGPDGPSAELATRFPALEGKRARKSRPTAYVCERGSCQAPTTDPSTLRRQLRQEPS